MAIQTSAVTTADKLKDQGSIISEEITLSGVVYSFEDSTIDDIVSVCSEYIRDKALADFKRIYSDVLIEHLTLSGEIDNEN